MIEMAQCSLILITDLSTNQRPVFRVTDQYQGTFKLLSQIFDVVLAIPSLFP